MTLLTVQNLSVSFKNSQGQYIPAVSDVSFDVNASEILGVVGESGSGKSVTALSILKLLPYPKAIHSPESKIFYNGVNLLSCSENALNKIRGKEISYIFQEPMSSLNPLHTIGKQLIESIKIHSKINNKEAYLKAVNLLKLVEISNSEERMKSYPYELSGGQRQRVMIAMAISNRPRLLIADEPTTALDVTIQDQIIKLLMKLCKEMSMAMIFISHNLRLVERIADKICVMQKGKIVEQGMTQSVFLKPHHSYTKLLLKSLTMQPKFFKLQEDTLLNALNLTVVYPLKKNLWGRVTESLKALNGVNLQLYTGETLGIVGESGSGKTTLGMCLADLCSYEGSIELEEKNIKYFNPLNLRKKIQIIFQDPYNSLNPRMTIEQIVGEGLTVFEPDLNKYERHQRVVELLQEVELTEDDGYKYPHEFSGGQRQRVAIARALAINPEILILDEPTSALDVTIQKQILELLLKLQKEKNLSYIFISHDIQAVKTMADRIAVMKNGEIVEIASAGEILSSPQQPYTKRLIEASLI